MTGGRPPRTACRRCEAGFAGGPGVWHCRPCRQIIARLRAAVRARRARAERAGRPPGPAREALRRGRTDPRHGEETRR